MSDAFAAALIGGGVAALVSAIFSFWNAERTRVHEKQKWVADEKRWKAELYGRRRFEKLSALGDAVSEATFSLDVDLPWEPTTVDEARAFVMDRTSRLHRAGIEARIFLDDEVAAKLLEATGLHRVALHRWVQAQTARIQNDSRRGDFDAKADDAAEKFHAANRDLLGRLRPLLNPPPL